MSVGGKRVISPCSQTGTFRSTYCGHGQYHDCEEAHLALAEVALGSVHQWRDRLAQCLLPVTLPPHLLRVAMEGECLCSFCSTRNGGMKHNCDSLADIRSTADRNLRHGAIYIAHLLQTLHPLPVHILAAGQVTQVRHLQGHLQCAREVQSKG